jgi:23S rRNA pseudouridine2605 synthase
LSGALPNGERLQKVLARVGIASRRVAEELIATGRVEVNGVPAHLGQRVDVATDRVALDGVAIGVLPGLVYYLLNKPPEVVTTASDPQGRRTVLEFVPSEPRVFPVGRLDYLTEGLLILTNDGELAQLLTHPSHGVEKEYLVSLDADAGPAAIRRLREGLDIGDGEVTAPAKVARRAPGVLRITIHEGRNRQVRRMCEAVGLHVERLVRTRIGAVSDPRLQPGAYRELTSAEVRALSTNAPRLGAKTRLA